MLFFFQNLLRTPVIGKLENFTIKITTTTTNLKNTKEIFRAEISLNNGE